MKTGSISQIVREQRIPLAPANAALEELISAQAERRAGYVGRTAEDIAADMENIIETCYETASV
jgi:hypothetical protein